MRANEKAVLSAGVNAKLKKINMEGLAECAVRFALAFVLSRARIFDTYSPFSVALAGASPVGAAGAATTLGATMGYLSSGDILWALKYIGILFLIRSTVYILRGTVISESVLFTPVVALCSAGAVGFVYAADGGMTVVKAAMFVVEMFIIGGCVFFYNAVFSPWDSTQEGSLGRSCHCVSVIILLSSILISLNGLVLFGVLSIGRMLAVLSILVVTFKGGTSSGCACGAVIGAAIDLASGTFPFITSVYSVSSAVSGIFSKDKRLVFLLAFIAVNAISVIWGWEKYGAVYALYETFAASVIFMLLPDSVFSRLSIYFPSNASGLGFLRAREYTRSHVEQTRSAFQGLYDAVYSFAPECKNLENPATIFDRASEAVCRSCKLSTKCWQQDYQDTVDIMNSITPQLMKNGKIASADFPARFTDTCIRLDTLTAEINKEAHMLLLKKQFKSIIAESQSTAYSQYADMALILRSISEELGNEITVEAAMERKLGKYLRSTNVDASAAVFRVRGGRLRAEIVGNTSSLRSDKEYLNKLSSLLGTRLCTSNELNNSERLVLLEAEPISISIGTSSAKKSGGRMSGDNSFCFRTDEGKFYAILSDGMGSGEAADRISSMAVITLRKFLCAGISPELSLKLLSDLMFLKNETVTESASIDLFELNMFSGDARIFKCGAAPTYLKRGEIIRRINSSLLPAGLLRPSKDKCSCAKFHLQAGSFAILISDGILSGTDDKWLRELICGFNGTEPKELSRNILETALKFNGDSDDMTVLAIRIDDRA